MRAAKFDLTHGRGHRSPRRSVQPIGVEYSDRGLWWFNPRSPSRFSSPSPSYSPSMHQQASMPIDQGQIQIETCHALIHCIPYLQKSRMDRWSAQSTGERRARSLRLQYCIWSTAFPHGVFRIDEVFVALEIHSVSAFPCRERVTATAIVPCPRSTPRFCSSMTKRNSTQDPSLRAII